jgi:hypothetical protein
VVNDRLDDVGDNCVPLQRALLVLFGIVAGFFGWRIIRYVHVNNKLGRQERDFKNMFDDFFKEMAELKIDCRKSHHYNWK